MSQWEVTNCGSLPRFVLNKKPAGAFRRQAPCLNTFEPGADAFPVSSSLQADRRLCSASRPELLSTKRVDEPGSGGYYTLLDKSLLISTDQENAEIRFTMLETIRHYGLDRLRAEGGLATCQRSYAMYSLSNRRDCSLSLW